MTEESLERFRRRRAILTVVPIWAGGLLLVGAGLMVLLGGYAERALLTGALALVGAMSVVAFTIRGRRLSKNAYRTYKANHLRRDPAEGEKTG